MVIRANMYAALSNIVWPRGAAGSPCSTLLPIRPPLPPSCPPAALSPGSTIGGGGEVAGGLSRRW